VQHVKRIARSITGSAFLRQNAVFLFGSLLVGFANYLYYPVLARLIRPDAYGEVQAIVSLFLQLTIFLTVLTQVTVNVVTNYTDEDHKRKVIFELERFASMVSIVLLVLGVILSGPLTRFFQFASVWPFIILLVVFVASVPLAFRSAYLRAHQKFGLTSAVNLVSGFGRILASAGLVLAGFSAAGAIGGLLAAQIGAFAYAAYEARKLGFRRPEGARYFSVPSLSLIAPELKYALLVLMGTTLITLLSSMDVFVAKHYFDPQTAGEYAGVSTVARTIFFLVSPIALVLLPAVRITNPAGENRKLLIKSVALTIAIGAPAVLICVIAAPMVVSALMGRHYLPYAHVLPVLSVAMLLLSIANVVISYYMALRKYQIWFIILICISGPLLVMWLHHSNVQDIAINLLYSTVGMLGLFAAWRTWTQLRKR